MVPMQKMTLIQLSNSTLNCDSEKPQMLHSSHQPLPLQHKPLHALHLSVYLLKHKAVTSPGSVLYMMLAWLSSLLSTVLF